MDEGPASFPCSARTVLLLGDYRRDKRTRESFVYAVLEHLNIIGLKSLIAFLMSVVNKEIEQNLVSPCTAAPHEAW